MPLLAILIPASYWIWHFTQNQWIESRDTIHLFYVIKRWCWNHLSQGTLPLWNDQLFTGFYQLASPALSIFSPFTAAFYLTFDSVLAEQLQLPLFAAIAGIGAYTFTNYFLSDKTLSLSLSASYALSGILLSLADRSPFFFAMALYPYGLYFLFCYLYEPSKNTLKGLGLAVTIALIAMNGDWVAATLLTIFFVVTVIYKTKHYKDILNLWPLLFIVGLSAISIWPVFENLSEATRSGGLSYTEASSFSLHPIRLFSFFLPELWGQIYDGSFWGHSYSNGPYASRFWYHSMYFGSVATLAGFYGAYSLPRSLRVLFLILLLGSISLSMGSYGPLHKILFEIFPPYRHLRYPEKFIVFAVIAWLGVAIAGFRQFDKRRFLKGFLVALGFWHAIAALCAYFVYMYVAPTSAAQSKLYSGIILHTFIGLTIFVLRRKINVRQIPFFLLAITTTELFAFAPNLHWVPLKDFSEAGIFVNELKTSNGRFLLEPSIMPRENRKKIMLNNWPILDGLFDISGYETIPPSRLMKIEQRDLFKHFDVWVRVLNLTDVITLASPRNQDLKIFADQGLLTPINVNSPLNLALLRWNQAPPKVELFSSYLLSSPTAAIAEIIKRGPKGGPAILESKPKRFDQHESHTSKWKQLSSTITTETFHVESDHDVLFVRRGSFHKNWHATVDHQETDVFRADAVSRAIVVPSGKHIVRFEFRPTLFYWSMWTSGATLLLGILILVRQLFKHSLNKA